MLNRDGNGLEIFDNFRTDYSLPKHNSRKGNGLSYLEVDLGSVDMEEGDSDVVSPSFIAGGVAFASSSHQDQSANKNKSFFRKIIDFFIGLFKVGKKPKMTIAQFFMAIKESSINIEQYTERSNGYIKAFNHAKKMNQTALMEELKYQIDQVKYESILYAGGFTTVITEEQVVNFYKECQKGLALTFIRNYIRVIPEKVLERKIEADALNVFDNYVIMFYDPSKKAYKIEKDPIIFGVINGIRKLYYIADYVDEFCDLTLEKFIEKFGEEAIKANDLTVNFKIKK